MMGSDHQDTVACFPFVLVFVVQGEPETGRHHHHRHESNSLARAPVACRCLGVRLKS